jgi:hypothetical protein
MIAAVLSPAIFDIPFYTDLIRIQRRLAAAVSLKKNRNVHFSPHRSTFSISLYLIQPCQETTAGFI